jgi:type II secretory pathway predicted ATPase ExeA
MYRDFFGMENIPFSRNVPPEMLYESPAMAEALGRMKYVSKEKLFAVVTADAGCGKSTLIRRLVSELPRE